MERIDSACGTIRALIRLDNLDLGIFEEEGKQKNERSGRRLRFPRSWPILSARLAGPLPRPPNFLCTPSLTSARGEEPIRDDMARPETTMDASAKAIGIDIGGTKIAVATVDARGAITGGSTIATEAELGFERCVVRIVDAADRALAAAGWSRKVSARRRGRLRWTGKSNARNH